jgi:hypothetical protein
MTTINRKSCYQNLNVGTPIIINYLGKPIKGNFVKWEYSLNRPEGARLRIELEYKSYKDFLRIYLDRKFINEEEYVKASSQQKYEENKQVSLIDNNILTINGNPLSLSKK